MTYLDHDGYPTEKYLQWIREYDHKFNSASLIEFIETIIDNWKYEGCTLRRAYKGHRTLELHTWGWSGNEDIIDALRQNKYFFMFHTKWTRGGHFYFEIPII